MAEPGAGRAAARHGSLRATQTERERMIDALQAAYVQDRLTKDEFDERLGQVLISRTYADLAEPLHQVGAVLEASSFHPGRTARAHLRIQALAADVDQSRIEDVLDLVGLADAAGRRVGGFSLGMRQRLGLATALLADPEVLILDEPANGLDPEGIRWLRGLLRGFAAEGGTVLVSSHMLAEVAQTIESVVIIDRGHLLAQGSVAELTANGNDLEEAFFQLTREAVR